MLDLDSRMEIFGITVFRDTDRRNQFYHLPGSPEISRDAAGPMFDLFTFRKGGVSSDAISGGFLNMTVDVGIRGLKARIESRLKEQFGDDITLSSVPFTKGSVRAIGLGEDSRALQGGVENERTAAGEPVVAPGPRFIEKVLGGGTPSLDADNRSIFSFSLSEDGAAFFLGALSSSAGARPIGIVYELEYVGLLPAYELEVHIDFKLAYEYMRTRFTLGTLFFRADIDNIVEQLRRNESIKIREVARTLELSTPEAIQARQQRIDQLVKDLASGAMFQPSLVPGEPRVKADAITAADPTTTAPTGAQVESAAMQALRDGPVAALVAGMGEVMLPPGARAGATPGGGGASPPAAAPQSSGTPPAQPAAGGGQPPANAGSPPRETAADVWNRLGRPQAAFALRRINQEEMRTVTYNLTQVTAQKQTVSPQSFIQFMGTPAVLRRRMHVIDLNHPFFQRINLNVTAKDVDFAAEGVKQMTVQLRYGTRPDGTSPKDSAEVILRAPTDARDFTFFADAKQTLDYEYKLIVDYQADFGIGVEETRIEGAWTRTEVRSLVVHPRWLGRVLPITLQLAPNIPEDVTEVQSIVRYVNLPRGIDDSRMVTLTKSNASEVVPIRLADASETFEVSNTIFFRDGASERLPTLRLPDAAAGSSDDVVVISVPAAHRLTGDIIMQDPFGELSSVLVDTRVEQGTATVDSRTFELLQAGGRQSFSVRLPQRDKPARLRYRERRVYKDGGVETEPFQDASSTNLVVGVPAEDVFTVLVHYIGPDLATLGVNALQLDLAYQAPDADPEFEQSSSILVTDDADSKSQEWKIRLPNRRARTYGWQLRVFFNDGTQSTTEPTKDTRSLLVLRPPQL